MLRTFQSRSLAVCSILMVGFSGLSVRLIQLQLVDRKRYEDSSDRTYDHEEILYAHRGDILDCNDEVLAKSLPVSAVWVNMSHLLDPRLAAYGLACAQASTRPDWKKLDSHDRAKLIAQIRGSILSHEDGPAIVEKHLAYAIGILARPLGMRREELRAKIEEQKNPKAEFAIARDIPGDVAEPLRDVVEESGIVGFKLRDSLKRWYCAPDIAAHVVGYTGEKSGVDSEGAPVTSIVGKTGIESAMDAYLAGANGLLKDKRNSRGLPMPGDEGSLRPPKAGLNVQLTIDMGIQTIAEEEIDAAMKLYNAKRAAVVVMDPKTGAIMAMVSRPNFDLNTRKNIKENGFNFALQAVYEPGSTFKIISTSGTLNEGLVTPQTSIFCENGKYQDGNIKLIKDDACYGMLTFEQILQHSSNIGSYKLARQLGPQRFYNYAHNYGFGKKTGILISGEVSGYVHNTGNPSDFSRAAFGYSLNVTPLQVARAYCAIANDGKLPKPRIVNALIANDGTVVERFEPETVGQPIKPETARKMRAALQKVVDKAGTAPLAAVPGYLVAGKTGTAQRSNPYGPGYMKDHYVVSFVGMMPAEDPKFVAVVVVDDPQPDNGLRIFGGTIAAPTFGKMAARIADAMNLQPTLPVSTVPARTATR